MGQDARRADEKQTEPTEDRARQVMLPLGELIRKVLYDTVLVAGMEVVREVLESVPEEIEERGTSKSTVSRRFVVGAEKKLVELMSRDLSELDLKALYIDGVHFHDHVVVVSVGVTQDGTKHVLGLWEGATENGETYCALLKDTGRAWAPDGPDDPGGDRRKQGAGECAAGGVRQAPGDPALPGTQDAQLMGALPKERRESVRSALNQAYRTEDHARGKRMLENLARQLEREHPGAGASVRKGLEQTLTAKLLGLCGALERTFWTTTNGIENVIGRVRETTGRVKRWGGGHIILRWCAAGVLEAESRFRRVNGYRQIPILVAALQGRDAELAATAA